MKEKEIVLVSLRKNYYKLIYRMRCVDMLGVEYNNKEIKLQFQDPVEIKIFNIFCKKDAPFNYNMTSNNGWLEVFIWGKNFYFLLYFRWIH